MEVKLHSVVLEDRKVFIKDLKPTDVFRFPETKLHNAIGNGSAEYGLFMVIDQQPKDNGRTWVLRMKDGLVMKKDEDRYVVHHDAVLMVKESIKEEK